MLTSRSHNATELADPKETNKDDGEISAAWLKRFVAAET